MNNPETRPPARTIAVTSGKGGVGKSCVTVNLACELARAGNRVLVIDADLGLANLDILLNVQANGTLHDVLHGKCSLEEVLLTGPVGVRVLPAGSGIAEHAQVTGDMRSQLPNMLERLIWDFDFIIIDTGAGIADVVLYAASLANEVLVVATPEPTSFADAYATIKVMAYQHQREKFHLVINQVGKGQSGKAIAQSLQQIADRFLPKQIGHRVALDFSGEVPTDTALEASVRARVPVILNDPESPVAVALRNLAKTLSRSAPLARGIRTTSS